MSTACLLSVLLSAASAQPLQDERAIAALFEGGKRAPAPVRVRDLGVKLPAHDAPHPMLTDPRYLEKEAARAQAARPVKARAKDGVRWTAEVFGGGNIGVPGTIALAGSQGGDGDVRFSHGSGGRPPYLSARVARWDYADAWELEAINTYVAPAAGEHNGDRDILRGYNHVVFGRAYEWLGMIWHLGAGAVVTHPYPTEAQQAERSSGSYHFAGLASQAAVTHRLKVGDGAFASVEGKVNGAVPRADTPDASIRAPAVSATGVLGIGFEF